MSGIVPHIGRVSVICSDICVIGRRVCGIIPHRRVEDHPEPLNHRVRFVAFRNGTTERGERGGVNLSQQAIAREQRRHAPTPCARPR
jgi:hypothetical protein